MRLPHQILVVEDEFLIAMELAQTLRRAGYQVVGPAASLGTAFELLRHVRPDAAVLDVNLAGERVTPVAEVLRAMAVPFVLSVQSLRSILKGEHPADVPVQAPTNAESAHRP